MVEESKSHGRREVGGWALHAVAFQTKFRERCTRKRPEAQSLRPSLLSVTREEISARRYFPDNLCRSRCRVLASCRDNWSS